MERHLVQKLVEWKSRKTRHPLILRGARQVGKTYLVRELAKREFSHFLELNFEADSTLSGLFKTKDPSIICELLLAKYTIPIVDGKTLLFLDELQAAEPCVLESLRYFYEKRPGLHVIAAGSLLEFMLDGEDGKERNFPMPVGRVEYMFVPPLDFEEFLLAAGRRGLCDWLGKWSVDVEIPDAIHEELSLWFRRFLVIGGMPAVVKAYFEDDISRAEREQQTILSTYWDDFPKYGKKASPERLRKVFAAVPAFVGRKMIYSKIDLGEKTKDMASAFNLLCRARVVAKVRHTPANGIPIGYGASDGDFKPLFLDVGLVCRSLRLKLTDFLASGDGLLQNKGELCEQFIGQHLLYSGEEYEEPAAYFWLREARNSAAEVDYVVQYGTDIVPVEVKGGTTGSMKGLHFFMNEKHRHFAVRFNADKPSLVENAHVRDTLGRECEFRLLSLPMYMVCQLMRLIRETKV